MNRAMTAAWTVVLLLSVAPATWAADPLAPLGVGPRPTPPSARPVDDTLYGTKVTDAYRFMEALDPQTIDWMKAQGAYTRRVLDAIRPLAALKTRTAAFSGSFGFIQSYATFGGRAFYQERAPGSDAFDLMVRQPDGQVRKVIDVAALRAAHGGTPYAINYILPSPDGSKVAAGVSSGGSEDADLFVYDAATGAQIGGPIDRAQFGPTSWSADSKTLYFVRLQPLRPGATPADKYLNVTLDAWDLTSEPVILLGATTGRGPAFSATEAPALQIIPGATIAVLASQNGVQNEIKVWTAPAAGAASPDAPWKLLADRSDGVTSLDARGDELFLLSHKDAPTFQVLTLKGGETLAQARVLVPARPDRVIDGVHAASDALYVTVRDGVYSHLLRIPAGSEKAEEVPLPVHGHAGEVFSDSRYPGLIVDMSSWTTQPTLFRYDPAGGFSEIHVGVRGNMDPAGFQVSDLKARAVDGVEIPLSLIQPKGVSGPQPTVVEAYGAYGISNLADFSTRRAQQMKEGITYAICHVRGGGELGEAWRLGGKDATKPNTWRDLIACGEDLIARGVTTKDKLFIIGGSAGGITMGRAMEERPDLFAGVMDLVPDANSTRSEFMPSGPLNIPEFGTVKTEQGFRNLYEMDAYLHVKPGVAYPAVMITTGLNDPRVAPWEPAKFAAALEAAGAPNPVLLRIDEQAGHGIGSTRTQGDLLSADEIAFVFWRSGREGWRPDAGATQ